MPDQPQQREVFGPPVPPHWFSDKELEQIAAMAGLGMPIPSIGAVMGMSRATFYRRMQEDARLRETVELGRGKAIGQVCRKAFEMANSGDHPGFTRWWLCVMAGWDKGPTTEDETSHEEMPTTPLPETPSLPAGPSITYEQLKGAIEKDKFLALTKEVRPLEELKAPAPVPDPFIEEPKQ